MAALSKIVVSIYEDIYPELKNSASVIAEELEREEEQFERTLDKGLKAFNKFISQLKSETIDGVDAFHLYDTYGFPIEFTQELARENKLSVDLDGFNEAFKKHQELSRSGSEKRFAGGLADTSEESSRLHTATHLLHKALKTVLGADVSQRGSNITAERLRFDFSYPEAMTPEQKPTS